MLFSKLLEPIVKYTEAAAYLATVQVTTSHDRSRIAHAGRLANVALGELTQALLEADNQFAQRELNLLNIAIAQDK